MKQNKIIVDIQPTIAEVNAIARQILDREWLQEGATQEELDTGRLLAERFNTELSAGHTAEEILQKWKGRSTDEILRDRAKQNVAE